MSKTKIEWTDFSWNPITGCSPVSEGCEHCYARRMAQRLKGRYGYPQDDPFRVTFHLDRLEQPLKWKKPRHIFVVSMGDLFHEDVDGTWIVNIFEDVIWPTRDTHIYLLLTKRPERMAAFFDLFLGWKDWYQQYPVWLGVTAENQQRADERIPILLQIPAAKHFVSIEPMLGPVSLRSPPARGRGFRQWDQIHKLDWVIVGGESGPGARPMYPGWPRAARDHCQEAGVPFFFKQWGEWIPRTLYWPKSTAYIKDWGTLDINGAWFPKTTPWNGREGEDSETREYVMYRVGKKHAGRLLDGREWNEVPD